MNKKITIKMYKNVFRIYLTGYIGEFISVESYKIYDPKKAEIEIYDWYRKKCLILNGLNIDCEVNSLMCEEAIINISEVIQ